MTSRLYRFIEDRECRGNVHWKHNEKQQEKDYYCQVFKVI